VQFAVSAAAALNASFLLKAVGAAVTDFGAPAATASHHSHSERLDPRQWTNGSSIAVAMARFLTTLLLCGLPACAWATSPYDVLTLPSRPLGGIAIAECGQYLGGLRTGSSCQYALDGRATLDRRGIPELGGWSLIADLEALGGGRPSADFVGDAQGVSNIEATLGVAALRAGARLASRLGPHASARRADRGQR
jgi:hypothetical protein